MIFRKEQEGIPFKYLVALIEMLKRVDNNQVTVTLDNGERYKISLKEVK